MQRVASLAGRVAGYRRGMGVRRAAGLVLAGLLLAGCSDPVAGPAPTDRPTDRATATGTGIPATDETPAAEPPAAEPVPLAIALHPRSAPTDLTPQQARRIARARTTRDPAALRAIGPGDRVAVPADLLTPAVRVATVDGVHPLREPQDYPLTTDGEQPTTVTTVTIVGDVMLGRRVGDVAEQRGDPAHALRPMARRLASADLTIGNLESTLSEAGPPTQGGDSFAAPPGVRAGLRAAGFDALSLANNHAGDFGDGALLETIALLEQADLRTFGAGRDLRRAARPLVLEHDGVRFGLVGFNAIGETPEAGPGAPGALSVSMPPRTGPLDERELVRVERLVRRLAARTDAVVVLPHWGTQYTHRPEPVQGQVAGRLVRAGADLVVGGHPHWVQGAALRGDALVVHSLGNFVFDMDFATQTMEGLVLEATFWDGVLRGVEWVPYRMGDDFAPRVLAWEDAGSVLDGFWAFSRLGS